MTQKILIPLYGNDVAPRFDLATEVLIVAIDKSGGATREEKIVVLPQASAEKLCHLILTDGINVVICGGIEEEYFQYLTWKRLKVLDSVIGPWARILDQYDKGSLETGSILYP